MNALVPLLVLTPLFGAALTLTAGRRRRARRGEAHLAHEPGDRARQRVAQ